MNILIFNQSFYPDIVATAQHAADLATHLTERGHQVTVVTCARGYDDPSLRFPKRETWMGVRIIRISALALGKDTRWRRMLNFASFILNCFFRSLTLPSFDLVVAMTSPPLIAFVAALLGALRGGQVVCWVMDLNPDEAIAAGWLKPGSIAARLLAALSLFSFRKARTLVVLDRFMKQHLIKKGIAEEKIAVIPPWSHDDVIGYDDAGREAFHNKYGLTGKFVVMYSGNHSPCHPLDTLLKAALQLAEHSEVVFCFVGGGSEFKRVRQFQLRYGLRNIVSLAYQPLDQLSGSLSAADLHVVVMGDSFVGIVHPCKVYNILHLGIPFLYIGPTESHVIDLVQRWPLAGPAYIARHGQVNLVATHILTASRIARTKCRDGCVFSKEVLCGQMVELLTRSASPFADYPLASRLESQIREEI